MIPGLDVMSLGACPFLDNLVGTCIRYLGLQSHLCLYSLGGLYPYDSGLLLQAFEVFEARVKIHNHQYEHKDSDKKSDASGIYGPAIHTLILLCV